MWRRLRQERRKESTLGREVSLTPVVYSVVRGDGNRTGEAEGSVVRKLV